MLLTELTRHIVMYMCNIDVKDAEAKRHAQAFCLGNSWKTLKDCNAYEACEQRLQQK